MANSVDLVIGSEAIKQVENLISKLSLADAELIKISQSASGASKGISGISTPTGLDKAVTNTSALNAQLEKQNAIINKLHADIAKRAEQSRLSEIKLQQAREKAFDSFERNAKREQAIQEKNASAYNKTQTQINNLTKVYNDLAIRKERYNNLSANEEMRLNTLAKITEKYNGILKATDATIGKNQRNVGNYASGYNALGNSINQLTREAPAFANSMNTGFMAISNNIPALEDAIRGIRNQNKALAEEGKPTTSVLKQLGASFFSMTTLVSIGVTLLTVFGAKLIEWAFNTDGVKKATDSLNASLKQNEEQVNKNIKAIEHQSVIDIELAKQRGASEKELSDLKIKLGIDTLNEQEKNYKKSTDLLNSFDNYRLIRSKSSNKALLLLLDIYHGDMNLARKEFIRRENAYTDENREILLENQKKTYQSLKEANDKNTELDAQTRTEANAKLTEEQKKAQEDALKLQEERLKDAFEANKKELELQLANIDIKLNNEDLYYSDRLTALDKDFLKRNEIAKLDYDEEFRLSKGSQDKQKTALLNFQLEKLKLIESYNKQKNTLEALDLDPITQLATSKSQDKDPFKSVIDSGKKVEKEIENVGKKSEDTKKRILELGIATSEWLGSFSSEFLQNSGMGSLETFFDGSFDKLLAGAETTEEKFAVTFNAIAESAQEAFNLISNYSQQNFEAEYSRLEAQKDISLKFAGDSTAAKQKIEDDYEKRRKEIANRENKAKQKQAIFNIAIDTAQAIMATVGKTGFAGLPLALILGALGAAQIAMVASQKIPEYWQGTDNASAGLAYTNERGAEIHTDKHGNIKDFGDNKGARLTMMAQGDKVYTAEETKRMMFNDDLNYMLNSRGVSIPINSQSNTMTAQQMDLILEKHFSKIQTNSTVIDKNGFAQWTEKRGNRTIQNANRVSRTGFKV